MHTKNLLEKNNKWKASFDFEVSMMCKHHNLPAKAIEAFKNSIVTFATGNVSENKITQLQEILNQIKTDDDLKILAIEDADDKDWIDDWHDDPYWKTKSNNTTHVVLDGELAADFTTLTKDEIQQQKSPDEVAWEKIKTQLDDWADKENDIYAQY